MYYLGLRINGIHEHLSSEVCCIIRSRVVQPEDVDRSLNGHIGEGGEEGEYSGNVV